MKKKFDWEDEINNEQNNDSLNSILNQNLPINSSEGKWICKFTMF